MCAYLHDCSQIKLVEPVSLEYSPTVAVTMS